MSKTNTQSLPAANENAWYCLATLHGEQPTEGFNRDLADKNRESWNRWVGDMTEGQRAKYATAFAQRASDRGLMLPERAGSPNFSNTYFDRMASFNGFHFPTGAIFSSSTFSQDVDFSAATFTGIADFNSTTFDKMADFRWTAFSEMASFQSTTFSGLADFESTKFAHAAHFDSATFFEGVGFSLATFANVCSFNLTTFSGATDFSSASFKGPVDFTASTFAREIHFVNAKLAAVTHFSNAHFTTRAPDFRGATLHEATEWHGVIWPGPPKTRSDAQRQVYSYERLKQEMDRLKKHDDEQSFFRKELRARRRLLRPLSGTWLLNLVYQISSDYGDSFSRPLLWLTGVFAVGTAIFANVPLCAGQTMPLKLAVRLSFANIFVFLNDKRELTTSGEMGTCLSNTTAAISAVQSISGVVLLFLLGLVLRNRFRMK